jgi:hypothetical protein
MKLDPRKSARSIILLIILLAPSIWMIWAIPPLWRDIDGYVQITGPPRGPTILGYAPLYCFLARFPLYLGYVIEFLKGVVPPPAGDFLAHPVLTDSGIFALLLSQHAALAASAFYLVESTTRFFWVRLSLSILWAANPLFYAFAHCVGSEALSLILVILLVTTGLRIMQEAGNVPCKEWLYLGILLCLCLVTRYGNAILIILMPLAFGVAWLGYFSRALFAQSRWSQRWLWVSRRRASQAFLRAVVISVAALLLANVSIRVLCKIVHIHYRWRTGQTFVWRLQFLAKLPADTRNQLLDQVSANTDSPEVRKLISMIGEAASKGKPWDSMAFIYDAQASLFSPEIKSRGVQLDRVLNHTVRVFLFPPRRVFLHAVMEDFENARRTTVPMVVNNLFRTTSFYFLHSDRMPGCAELITFRGKNAAQIENIFAQHSYFNLWKPFNYNVCFTLWLGNLLLLFALARRRARRVADIAGYSITLTIVGLLAMLGSCFITEFLPRYTLPMWTLLILSLLIVGSRNLELCKDRQLPSRDR